MSCVPSLEVLARLYQTDAQGALLQQARYQALADRFAEKFGDAQNLRFFSAPGRTELAGNHTDHNKGCVLAAAVDLDSICAARENDLGKIRLWSEGYDDCFEIDLMDLTVQEAEYGTTQALLRGVCAGMAEYDIPVCGFDAVCASQVAVGSGLSSSAAFEVLIATVIDGLFGFGNLPAIDRAMVAQFAENEYFGKPSGLMDQAASASGALVAIDFGGETAQVDVLDVDFTKLGYVLAVTFTGGSHDDLTDCYASIPADMKAVSACFGKDVLRQVDEAAFYDNLPVVLENAGDRAVLRAIHFFDENARVLKMRTALEKGDMQTYLNLTNASGQSSWMQLQNVLAPGGECKLALALTLSRNLLAGKGAWRVHGGGFAGTILSVMPESCAQEYREGMEKVFGKDSVRILKVRTRGAVEVPLK